MSRCFPFPPPGYTRNGSHSDALIQSIKLQMEVEKVKKDRKERKKEKKEKREEKKKRKELKKAVKEKKRKESTILRSVDAVKRPKTSHSSDTGKKFKLMDPIKEPEADGKLQKVVESELAERSVITEELGPAACSSQEPCTSDSSQNSKRKRDASLPSHDHGVKAPIRIRIPLKKHREPEESEQICQLGSSSSKVGATDTSIQDTRRSDSQLQCTANVETHQLTGKIDSRNCNPLQNSVLEVAPVTNDVVDDESRRMAALYNSLFQIQIPPLTHVGLDSVDQDWLFSSAKLTKAKLVSMKPKVDSEAFQCSKHLGPRAQYLPEIEIYALPYAIPF